MGHKLLPYQVHISLLMGTWLAGANCKKRQRRSGFKMERDDDAKFIVSGR